MSGREGDDVVQISTDHQSRTPRNVAGGDSNARYQRKPVGKQAALKQVGDLVLPFEEAGVLDGRGDPIRGELQKLDLLGREATSLVRSYDHYSDQMPGDLERDSDHGRDALGEDGAIETGRGEVFDDEDVTGLGYPTADRFTQRDVRPLEVLQVPATYGADRQGRHVLRDQLDHRHIGLQYLTDPTEELFQEIVQRHVGESRFRDPLELTEPPVDGLGLRASVLFELEEPSAFGLRFDASGDIPDVAREESRAPARRPE